MKVAEFIVKFLEERGINLVFGLPGYNILDVYDVLRTSSIEHLLVKHENAAAVMADVYGRLTGKPGICITTAGPGATNAVTGIAGALAASSPLIHLAGHCSSKERIQPYHGVDDWFFLEKVFSSVTKWSRTVVDPSEVPKVIAKAFEVASSGRPGPVHVSLPMDILGEELTGEIRFGEIGSGRGGVVKLVNEFIDLIPRTEKPAIIVGQGVLRAFCWDEVAKLAEKIRAPIFFTRWSRSAIPFDHPLNVGYFVGLMFRRRSHPLVDELFNESDLVLTFGVEEGSRAQIESIVDGKPVFHVFQGDGDGFIKITERSVQLNVGSLKLALKALLDLLPRKVKSSWIDVESRISRIKREIESELEKLAEENSDTKPIHPAHVLRCVRELLDRDAIVACDIGSNFVWTEYYYRVRTPNSLLSPCRYGSMGFSLPAAIAAKKVFGDRQVIAIAGDGGMLMMMGELSTLAEHNLPIPVIVLNDSKYGILWRIQQRWYGGRSFAVDIASPNFADCARAFGIKGLRVEDPRDVYSAIEEALSGSSPVVVDILTGHHYEYYKYRL